MNKKTKAILLVIALATFLLVVFINFFYQKQKQKEDKQQKEEAQIAKQRVVSEAEDEIGGVIVEDGFSISYESGKDRLIITITDEPYIENKEKAITYLKNKNIDLCEINYLILASRGIDVPRGESQTPVSCE